MNTDKTTRPQGVFAAAATAMNGDYSLDLGRTTAHWFRLLDEGCHNLAVFGTTGEANSLSMAERMSTLEAAVKTGVPAQKLWPGTGCCALPDTIDLTRHALETGAAGVLVLPPFYYKGVGDEGLGRWFSTLIEQVNDPRLSLVLYHFPAMSGVPITHGLLRTLLRRYPHNVTGIKDSTGELESALGFIRDFPDLAVLPGGDPLLLPVTDQGGSGCITAIANIGSPLLRRIWDCRNDPERRDEAEAAHEILCEMRRLMNGPELLPSVKAVIALLRGDPAWRHVRPPLQALAEERLAGLHKALAGPLEKMTAFNPAPQMASSSP